MRNLHNDSTSATTFARSKPEIAITRSTALFLVLLLIQSCQQCHALAILPDPAIHFSVGAVAGATGAIAAYPFDYIKSQMQTEYGAKTYKNGMDAFVTTITQKNPLDLYKGVGVQVAGIAPEKGIKLGVNDMLRASFVTSMGSFPLWGQVLSGAASGACQVVASSPLEVLKVGLQTSDLSFWQVWKTVGGFGGLFRGAEACILRDVLFTAVCFPLYASLVDSGMNTFAAGAVSGVVSSFVATPPDVIKTRILSQDKLSQQKRQIGTISQQQQQHMSYPTSPAGTSSSDPVASFASSAAMYPSDSTAAIATPILATAQQQQQKSSSSTPNDEKNPFVIGKQIAEREGAAVLFSGVTERCVGAIPRFGTTMAVHDLLEDFVAHAGWLSHHVGSI